MRNVLPGIHLLECQHLRSSLDAASAAAARHIVLGTVRVRGEDEKENEDEEKQKQKIPLYLSVRFCIYLLCLPWNIVLRM